MNFRPARVSNLIQEELAKLVVRDVELPVGALATITAVQVDPKLEMARVLVSILPAQFADASMKILVHAQGDLQYKLLKKMNIKPMPRIRFILDHGNEDAAAVEKALLELKKDEGQNS